MNAAPPPILVLTGEPGVGKTTLLERIAADLQTRNIDVAGLVSPAVFSDGAKREIASRDLRSGEAVPMAVPVEAPRGPDDLGWRLLPEGADWANAVLRRSTPCDVLLIDEIGPNELLLNAGWREAFDVLENAHYRAALVVVRPILLDAFRQRFPERPPAIHRLTDSTRRETRERLLAALLSAL